MVELGAHWRLMRPGLMFVVVMAVVFPLSVRASGVSCKGRNAADRASQVVNETEGTRARWLQKRLHTLKGSFALGKWLLEGVEAREGATRWLGDDLSRLCGEMRDLVQATAKDLSGENFAHLLARGPVAEHVVSTANRRLDGVMTAVEMLFHRLGEHPHSDETGACVQTTLDCTRQALEKARSDLAGLLDPTVSEPAEKTAGSVRLAQVVLHTAADIRGVFGGLLDLRGSADPAAQEAKVSVPEAVVGDAIWDLALNAQQAGATRVRLQVSRTTDQEGSWVLLKVADNGPGIPLELQPRIFERGFTTKQDQGGTGLGLATVHDELQLLGGGIFFESLPGEGTTFFLQFPEAGTTGSAL